jgi:DNA-binding CsgD family transcriptional regulator
MDPATIWAQWLAGRWRLIQQFDQNGKRYLVLSPLVGNHRGRPPLTNRERQVLAHATGGHPLKVIAEELGITIGTVSRTLKSGLRKLGLGSRGELIRIWANQTSPWLPVGEPS